MPSQSDVSICNLALTMLASSRIMSLTQDDENARKCNAVFSYIRDNLLSKRNWNFATKEASLALLDETPVVSEWSKIFQLPTDCLRVLRQEGDYPFKIVGNKLYSNESSCKIQYIAKITDASKFPTYFANALAFELAATLAFGITQNATLAQGMVQMAQVSLKEAVWSDAQEGTGTNVIQSSFITARQTGSSA